MAQIQQKPDGTYVSTYSEVELTVITQLHMEIEDRTTADQELWSAITGLGNQISALNQTQGSLSDMQNLITDTMTKLDEQNIRIRHLEDAVIIDAYTKSESDQLFVEWKIEQIAHTFDVPANHMFDQANLDDIRMGYKHYNGANINEPKNNHIPENTMQRYTIWAFASTPKQATFSISYADRLVVIVDDQVKATYIDTNGNFDRPAKQLVVDLKEGWTKIQFLLANETQYGGLVVSSDLYTQADYLSCLDYFAGLITGNRIQSGSLDERHFSPNMDLYAHTVHATATDLPAIVVGNPEEQGSIQIGDGILSKAKNEPFVFHDSIRVEGFISVTQLRIDQDFIRAGEGMIVKTLKDVYGYTYMYEIINDVHLFNGGGLLIVGNGQSGYTLTNDLHIRATEGLSIDGDPTHGYDLLNTLDITGKGIRVEPTGNIVKGVSKYNLVNDTAIDQDTGVLVTKVDDGHYRIKNSGVVTLQAGNNVVITNLGGGAFKIDAIGGAATPEMQLSVDAPLIVQKLGVNNFHLSLDPNALKPPAATVASLTTSPSSITMEKNATVSVTVTAHMSDGTTQDVTNSVVWTESTTIFDISGSTVTSNNVASTSTAIAIASYQDHTVDLTITVNGVPVVPTPTLSSITISPSSITMSENTTKNVTITANYSDGTTKDVTNAVSWTDDSSAISENGGAITSNNVSAMSTAVATASYQGKTASVNITINDVPPPVLSSITVTPASQTITEIGTGTYTVTAHYADGSTQDVTNLVSWTDTAYAYDVLNGVVTGSSINATVTQVITGTYQGKTADLSVTVTDVPPYVVDNLSNYVTDSSGNKLLPY